MMPGTWKLYGPDGKFLQYLWVYEVAQVTAFFQCVVDVAHRSVEMI